jgi:hypothetical protein
MTLLNEEDLYFERDAEGTLLPKTVDLVNMLGKKISDKQIRIVPLTRGDIKKLAVDEQGNTTKDQDLEIIRKNLIEPRISEEKIAFMKSAYADAIVATILKHSSLNATDLMSEDGESQKKK